MARALFVTVFLALVTSLAGAETLIIEAPSSRVWSEWTSSSDANVLRLVELLQRGATGRALVESASRKARALGLTLTDLIEPGEGSLTDTTLIRKFHPDRPEDVAFETRSKVFVNRHLGWREALLDLAHELTHFVHREPFNPYTLNFSLADFIHSTIEGRGGEVHAFVTECQVMRELFTSEFIQDTNCGAIDRGAQGLDRARAVELFYHVGTFYPQMKKVLDSRGIVNQFPHLKEERVRFVSSAYGMPYPLAAMQEYQSVLAKVCENDRRRLNYMGQSKGRSPASVEEFRNSVEQRCRTVSQN